MGWSRRAATAASLFTGVFLVLGATFAVVTPTPGTVGLLAVGLAVGVPSVALGLVIERRLPGHAVGLWLTVVGWTFSMVTTKEIWIRLLDAHRDLLGRWIWTVAVLDENLWVVIAVVGVLLLHFPSGRLPGPRWRPVPALLLLCAVLQQAAGAYDTAAFRAPLTDVARPFGKPPLWLNVSSFFAFCLELVLVLACAASLAVRYRRADRTEQIQLKWLTLAGVAVPLYPPLCLVEILAAGRPLWLSAAIGLSGLVGIPVSTGIAVLRHDLYDVEKAWAVTVSWALVTTLLAGVYAAASSVAGLLLGRGSPVVAAVVTAGCALALAPLRFRLQHAVDRRLYPLRPAAFAALDTLQRDVGSGLARPEQLEAVLRTALRDPELRAGFRVPAHEGFTDVDGRPVDAARAAEIQLGGRTIGLLVPGVGLATADLLRQVAEQASTMAEVVRLRLELAQALREVESSRARLVQTGYEERRQLERDLHDGAQQRLVSLGMAIRLAQRHLDDGTIDVDELLDQSVAELGTAVAELRQIARGLRPASLDDGLPAALAGLVRSLPVVVDMDVCPDPLPDDVATTVYFVVSEAVANAMKHAEASCIRLRVQRVDGHVVVRVDDDGNGGATLRPQSSIADRVAALGGRLRIESPAGRGTLVEAALPCAS
jgi:signal transduction histidine kinase